MRRFALLSTYFPPSAMASVHRARLLAKHLPAHGWKPVVVCVDEGLRSHSVDRDLEKTLPLDVECVRVRAFPAAPARWLGIGDPGIRGYFPMKNALDRIFKATRPEALMVTVLPGFPMKMAPYFKKKYGVPVILDFQDPWVSDWGMRQPRLSKAGLAHALARWIEPGVVRCADHITTVSEGTSDVLRRLYPGMPAARFSAIPIGGDAADFGLLNSLDLKRPWPRDGRVHISHVGTLFSSADRTLSALFLACAAIRRCDPPLFDKIALHFVGASNDPDGFSRFRIKKMAAAAGVGELVDEIPQRVPYFAALNYMAHSDILLMIGSHEPHYTASKLYPVLMSKRPVLAIFHAESAIAQAAARTGGIALVPFTQVEDRIEAIRDALLGLLRAPGSVPPLNPAALEPYSGETVAGRYADILNAVCGREKN